MLSKPLTKLELKLLWQYLLKIYVYKEKRKKNNNNRVLYQTISKISCIVNQDFPFIFKYYDVAVKLNTIFAPSNQIKFAVVQIIHCIRFLCKYCNFDFYTRTQSHGEILTSELYFNLCYIICFYCIFSMIRFYNKKINQFSLQMNIILFQGMFSFYT
jgi:hypothetical protein